MNTADAVCASCGRPMTPRRRFSHQQQPIKYCSKACRARRVRRIDKQLESAILELLESRDEKASICPSEAARKAASDGQWRTLMEPTRRAARRLAHAGRIDIVQRGRVVDPGTFKGPVRLRKHRGTTPSRAL